MSGVVPAVSLPTVEPGARVGLIARRERFAEVDSTNDVVRAWLAAGGPEVCLAVADRQSAGRGRAGRHWVAPAGAALLLSLGFRPRWLAADRTWRLAAVVALAMAEAAEELTALPAGAVRLKWPNDLVVEDGGSRDGRSGVARKLAGLLGETEGLGTDDPRATIGIGINVSWPAADFPADLADGMTSLHELAGGAVIDRTALLEAFLSRLEPAVHRLRGRDFMGAAWIERQLTSGRTVRLEQPDGSAESVHALGVDPDSGALVVADPTAADGRRRVFSGEIQHLRLADASAAAGSSAPAASSAPDAPPAVAGL